MLTMKKIAFLLVLVTFIVFFGFGETSEQETAAEPDESGSPPEEMNYFMFLPNSSTLFVYEEQALIQLDALARYLTDGERVSGQITVCGYSTPFDDYPFTLSKERALFVITELQKRGVPEELFSDPIHYDQLEQDRADLKISDSFWNVKILLDGDLLAFDTLKPYYGKEKTPEADDEPAAAESTSITKTSIAKTSPGPYAFTLSPLFGMFYGKGEEMLYKYSTGDQFASQLLWDMKPLFYTGLSAEFGLQDPFSGNGFTAIGSIKFALPMKTGIMEDRDWNYRDNDNLTNYSKHNSFTRNAIFGDLKAGYSWKLRDDLTLGARGEFSFMYLSWTAEDGYYQYLNIYIPGQTWNSSIPKEYLHGPVIQYNQVWAIVAPCIFSKWRINDLFSAEGFFSYSPLIYGTDQDDHLVPSYYYNEVLMIYERYEGTRFYGQYFGGHYINGGAKFIYSLKNFELSLDLSYRYIAGLRGMSYYQDIYLMTNASNPVIRNVHEGGMGYSALDCGITAKFYIF